MAKRKTYREIRKERREEIRCLRSELAEAKAALEFSAGAIKDAIHTEEGLEPSAGEAVLEMINKALGEEAQPRYFDSVYEQLAEANASSQKANSRFDAVLRVCNFEAKGAPQEAVEYIQWLNAARERAEAKCAELGADIGEALSNAEEQLGQANDVRDRAKHLIAKWRKRSESQWKNGDNGQAIQGAKCADELEQALRGKEQHEETKS